MASKITQPMPMQAGMVTTQAVTIRPATPQRTAEARRVATILAIAGRPIEEDALVAVLSLTGEDARSALLRLEVRDVASRVPAGWVVAHDALAESLESMAAEDATEWILVVTSARVSTSLRARSPRSAARSVPTALRDDHRRARAALRGGRGPDRTAGYFPFTIESGGVRTWLAWHGGALAPLAP